MSKMMKREGPQPVLPVEVHGLRIEAPHSSSDSGTAHDGGFLVAYDTATGDRLWDLEVYRVDYNQERELDVQDVFITSLTVQEGKILVRNEATREYLVDAVSRSVTKLPTKA
jgi:hypothetical protein